MTPRIKPRRLKLSERFWLWWHNICPKHFERRSNWVTGKPGSPFEDHYRLDIMCPVCRREEETREHRRQLARDAKERRIAERAKALQLDSELMNGLGMAVLLVFMFVVVTLL